METAETLITENFETWTSAIKMKASAGRGGGKKLELYGIKKLRELILEMAVRGLLVSQDPTEQSAIECLKGSNRGILGFDKILDQHAPSGWVSLPLGCIIASNIGGGTPSKSNPGYWGGEILWASVKDIQSEKFIDSTIDTITAAGLENSSSNLIPPNRLLIVTRMGLGKLAINKCAVAINQDLRAIEPISALDLNYGYLLFKALNLVGKGMTVKGVKIEELHAIPVLLPPLAEQHRISAKFDELMVLCDHLEQKQEDGLRTHQTLVQSLLSALTTASERDQFDKAWKRIESNFDTLFFSANSIDALKQTFLQLAVMGKLAPQDPNDEPASELLKKIAAEKAKLAKAGLIKKQKPLSPVTEEEEPYLLPSSWLWCRLGEAGIGSTGKTPKTGEVTSFGGLVEFIGPGQITPTGELLESDKTLTEEGVEKSTEALPGDILMVCIGGSIGKSVIADRRIAFNQQINAIRPIGIFSKFLNTAVSTDRFYKSVLRNATGSATPIINRSRWEDLVVPLPPAKEQHRIVAKLGELMVLCDQLQSRIKDVHTIQLDLADTLVAEAIN